LFDLNSEAKLNVIQKTEVNLVEVFQRRVKKKIEDGEVRTISNVSPKLNHLYCLRNLDNLDSIFSEYRLGKNFYFKNSKQPIRGVEGANSLENT